MHDIIESILMDYQSILQVFVLQSLDNSTGNNYGFIESKVRALDVWKSEFGCRTMHLSLAAQHDQEVADVYGRDTFIHGISFAYHEM